MRGWYTGFGLSKFFDFSVQILLLRVFELMFDPVYVKSCIWSSKKKWNVSYKCRMTDVVLVLQGSWTGAFVSVHKLGPLNGSAKLRVLLNGSGKIFKYKYFYFYFYQSVQWSSLYISIRYTISVSTKHGWRGKKEEQKSGQERKGDLSSIHYQTNWSILSIWYSDSMLAELWCDITPRWAGDRFLN